MMFKESIYIMIGYVGGLIVAKNSGKKMIKKEFKRYYTDLFKKIQFCSKLKVPITLEDRQKYHLLIEENPQAFFSNKTKYYFMQLRKDIREGKVWRNNISGRVRHGKSEVAQTWIMIYIDEFNLALSLKCFENLKTQGIDYKKEVLKPLNAKTQILFSQSNYLYDLREKQKNNDLIYGFPRIVDEDQMSIGGVGSYSERVEIENVNNITAQSLQAEYQLRPDRFVLLNAHFGLHQEKMDRVNKVNWSMLYEFNTDPTRTRDYTFVGWVATPLHDDNALRVEYNRFKKENINKIYEGTADLRMLERVKVSTLLSKDSYFSLRSANGKTFKLSKGQQEAILRDWIINRKCQNFNAMELIEIIEHARMLSERDYLTMMNNKGVA